MGLKSPVSGYPNCPSVSSCLVSVNDSAASNLRARPARPLATNQPMPGVADEPEQTLEAWFT